MGNSITQKSSKRKEENGFLSFYDLLFNDIFMERSLSKPELNFILEQADLQQGDSILDQGCGTGIVSVPLAELGFKVTGIDMVPDYIERAKQRASEHGVNCKFMETSFTSFECEPEFDCVLSWWTSWGHGKNDDDNIETMRMAYQALHSGGKYILDWMNLPHIIANFQPSFVTKQFNPKTQEEIVISRECFLDLEHAQLLTDWTFTLADREQVKKRTAMLAYMPYQIAGMMRQVGFHSIKVWGDFETQPLSIGHKRVQLVASK